MDKKRDLGFFNGIKTEIIPLIAGLVSFTFLAEDAVNQIERIFHTNGITGILVFISVYFIVPVVFIVSWLTAINYDDGLKAHFIRNKNSRIVWLLFVILLLLVVLLPACFLLPVRYFFWLSVLGCAMTLVYIVRLILLRGESKSYKREYLQAKWQLGLTVLLLLGIWTPYFQGYVGDAEFKDQWSGQTELLPAIRLASDARTLYEKQSKSAESFLDHVPDFFFAPMEGDLGQSGRKQAIDSLSRNYRRIWEPMSIGKQVHFVDTVKRFNIDSIRYIVYRKQITNLKEYQDAWAPWLMILQFKGLLIFSLLGFLLLAVWYHSYHLQLDRGHEEEFSEVAISKLSIYILFLLIIPFFKPIEKRDISFGKPYITFTNPISFSNKVYVDVAKPETPVHSEVDYIRISHNVDSIVDKRLGTVVNEHLKPIGSTTGKIEQEMVGVKKRPIKPRK